jgi:hypothetical protein
MNDSQDNTAQSAKQALVETRHDCTQQIRESENCLVIMMRGGLMPCTFSAAISPVGRSLPPTRITEGFSGHG